MPITITRLSNILPTKVEMHLRTNRLAILSKHRQRSRLSTFAKWCMRKLVSAICSRYFLLRGGRTIVVSLEESW